MAVSNIINVEFGNITMAETAPCYQYDYGQILKFTDLILPPTYEVHFSNNGTQGIAYTQIGDSDGVIIPDTLFQTGKAIYAFIYLHNGENDGHTAYVVRIPIIPRAKPTNYVVPTPEEQSALADAISAIEKMGIKMQQMQGGATPPTADSIAKMTEENQIYIYTGSEPDYIFGNWYYYNQNTSKWETGGQYASGIVIDSTLTQSEQAADAYETGLKINELRNNQIVFSDDGNGNIVLTKHLNT